MRIIPAIDIIDGQCVRLSKGNYETKKVYSNNPVEVAKEFQDHGINYLHVVDLDGAKSEGIKNYQVLENICHETTLKVDFGGGLKNLIDIKRAFNAGANQVTLGSAAIKQPQEFMAWLKGFGSEKIILGADCRNRKIATDGWYKTSEIDVVDLIKNYENIASYVVCTDIETDGMLQGPSLELYKEIVSSISINLIASGGVSSIQDLKELKTIGCEGAIVGKALYEGKIRLNQLKELC